MMSTSYWQVLVFEVVGIPARTALNVINGEALGVREDLLIRVPFLK